jgi:hypothetical protein
MHIPGDGWGVLDRPVRWFAHVPRVMRGSPNAQND